MDRKLLAAPVLALALAACSGHASAGHTGSVVVESPHAQTLSSLLSALHCEAGTTTTGDVTLYASDGGACTTDAGDVTVTMFASQANRDKWLQIAKGFGGGYVVGDKWVVATDTASAAQTVQPRVGGKVES